jgi:hypothetical protein
MTGFDHFFLPVGIMYLLLQIPPTMNEILTYFLRGGLVMFDCTRDDTFHYYYQSYTDWYCYLKRFCDRPKSDGANAYFAYLDWSAAAWDKSIYVYRRSLAKRDWEVNRFRPYVYGPFLFNWKAAHNKQWLRGDDAGGMIIPMWGVGGEERARGEFAIAEEKGFRKHWHYQIMKKINKEQAAKAKVKAAEVAAETK